jgi:hypothetical protein
MTSPRELATAAEIGRYRKALEAVGLDVGRYHSSGPLSATDPEIAREALNPKEKAEAMLGNPASNAIFYRTKSEELGVRLAHKTDQLISAEAQIVALRGALDRALKGLELALTQGEFPNSIRGSLDRRGVIDIRNETREALSRLDQAMGKPGDENPVYIRPPEDTF